MIVAKDRSCPVTPVVEKTAAGALSHLPLCQVTNLARAIDALKKAGVWCYGLAGEEGGAVDLFEFDLSGNLALVVGSEGKGSGLIFATIVMDCLPFRCRVVSVL